MRSRHLSRINRTSALELIIINLRLISRPRSCYESSLLTRVSPYIPPRSRSYAFDLAAPCKKKREIKIRKKRKRVQTHSRQTALSGSGSPRARLEKQEVASSSLARKIHVSRFRPDNVRARPRQLMAFDFWLTSHRSAVHLLHAVFHGNRDGHVRLLRNCWDNARASPPRGAHVTSRCAAQDAVFVGATPASLRFVIAAYENRGAPPNFTSRCRTITYLLSFFFLA